jgi:adenosylhomocysteine nucleosidase
MKILVTFAVEAEFAPWRKLRPFAEWQHENVTAYTARAGDAELIVLLTGVGGRKSRAEATKIIWDGNVNVCISSGLAGALKPEHRPGDVLAAREVHAAAWDKVILCDQGLLKRASACGAKVAHAFHTADRVFVRSEEKRELGAKADAVEMESGGILLEAVAFGAKVLAVRAISDAVDEDLPLNFNQVINDGGDVSVRRILMQAASHPGSIPALIRFGRQSRHAAEMLATFLECYIQKLALLPWSERAEKVSAR